MALDTYDGLKAAIADYLDRDDLVTQVDDFIDLAEAAHRDEVRFREILVRDPITLPINTRTLSLPADFSAMKHIRILNPVTGGSRRYLPNLEQLSESELTELSTNDTQWPRFFFISDLIEFDAETDQEYTGEMLYYKVMTPLSDVNGETSNELLVRAPDLYLYGALKSSAPFLMNDERIATWQSLYQSALARVNTTEKTNRRSGPQISRVQGQSMPRRSRW